MTLPKIVASGVVFGCGAHVLDDGRRVFDVGSEDGHPQLCRAVRSAPAFVVQGEGFTLSVVDARDVIAFLDPTADLYDMLVQRGRREVSR